MKEIQKGFQIENKLQLWTAFFRKAKNKFLAKFMKF